MNCIPGLLCPPASCWVWPMQSTSRRSEGRGRGSRVGPFLPLFLLSDPFRLQVYPSGPHALPGQPSSAAPAPSGPREPPSPLPLPPRGGHGSCWSPSASVSLVGSLALSPPRKEPLTETLNLPAGDLPARPPRRRAARVLPPSRRVSDRSPEPGSPFLPATRGARYGPRGATSSLTGRKKSPGPLGSPGPEAGREGRAAGDGERCAAGTRREGWPGV